MCSAAPHQHTHSAGLLWFLAISMYTLAAGDISLASISSEVSRLVGLFQLGARRALCNARAPRSMLFEILEATDVQ